MREHPFHLRPTPIATAIGVVLCLALTMPAWAQNVPVPTTPQRPETEGEVPSPAPTDPEPSTEPKDVPSNSEEQVGEESSSPSNEDVPFIWVDLCLKDNEKCINGVPARQVGESWEVDVSDDDLKMLDLDPSKFTRKQEEDSQWLSVPNAKFDEAALKITWSAGFENLIDQGFDEKQKRIATDVSTKPLSLALNYNVANRDGDSTSLFTSVALGKGNFAVLTDYSWDSVFKTWERGLVRAEYDQLSKGLRWTAGDFVMVSHDPLGAAGLIQGIGVRRSFEQDPTQVIVARPRLTGIIERPGTLEVYSNGILISSQEVRPGPFNLENLGISSGRQNLQIVLKDITGQRTTISSAAYYGSSLLLAKGLSDYGASVGKAYAAATDLVAEEKKDVAQVYWRRGINERVTLGARADYSDNIHSYGLTSAFATPWGEFSLAGAQSSAGGRSYLGTYGYSSQLWSAGMTHWKQDANYLLPTSNINDSPDQIVATRTSASVSLGFIPHVSVGLQGSRTTYQSGLEEESKNVSFSGQVFKKVQWSLLFRDIERSDKSLDDKAVSLLISIPLGNQRHMSFTSENSEQGTAYGASYSKSRREEYGLGYAGSASQSVTGDRNINLRADYQTPHGLYALQADQFAGENSFTASLAGSMVWTRKNVLFGPPLGGSFAIITAPGAPNAPVLREATPVGLTNKKGVALIRGMTPFYPTQLGFNPDELSIDVATGNAISKKIIPTAYTATVVNFDAAPAQAIQAQLMWPENIPIKYGSITFDDPINQTISLGSTGMLWLEQVPSGVYEGLVNNESGTARCAVNVPDNTEGVQDVGEVVCERLTGKPIEKAETQEPKQEEPKQEEPKQEEPKQEEPKQEEPKQEEPKQEEEETTQ